MTKVNIVRIQNGDKEMVQYMTLEEFAKFLSIKNTLSIPIIVEKVKEIEI